MATHGFSILRKSSRNRFQNYEVDLRNWQIKTLLKLVLNGPNSPKCQNSFGDFKLPDCIIHVCRFLLYFFAIAVVWTSRVAQWKRAGPITQRSVDRNHALLEFFPPACLSIVIRISRGRTCVGPLV